ncbi:hypothetical protein GY487_001069 [Escherichia coli]|nr:hypothetical protein [Escherichia coli]
MNHVYKKSLLRWLSISGFLFFWNRGFFAYLLLSLHRLVCVLLRLLISCFC